MPSAKGLVVGLPCTRLPLQPTRPLSQLGDMALLALRHTTHPLLMAVAMDHTAQPVQV